MCCGRLFTQTDRFVAYARMPPHHPWLRSPPHLGRWLGPSGVVCVRLPPARRLRVREWCGGGGQGQARGQSDPAHPQLPHRGGCEPLPAVPQPGDGRGGRGGPQGLGFCQRSELCTALRLSAGLGLGELLANGSPTPTPPPPTTTQPRPNHLPTAENELAASSSGDGDSNVCRS